MSANNFGPSLNIILGLEGGFSDNPADPGRATNHGIDFASWQHWVGQSRVVTTQDIKNLTVADVTPLYKKGFWDAVHADLLPAGIDLATFDFAVNAGPREGAKALQQALQVPADGLVGPVTLTAAEKTNPDDLIDEISRVRVAFYHALDDFDKFGAGWVNRVNVVEAAAKKMAADAGSAAISNA